MDLAPHDRTFDVAVVHGCASEGQQICVPKGHTLSPTRLRRLFQSELVIVTRESRPIGFAAYKRADSEVRIVHEFMIDRTLSMRVGATVVDALIVSIEMQACDEGVECLMFMLFDPPVPPRFEHHGYEVITAGPRGAWIQKKMNRPQQTHDILIRPN